MELLFIVLFHDFMHGDYRVEQVAIFLDTSPRDNAGALRDDEPTLLQQMHMLGNGIAGKVQSFGDGSLARMTLIRFPIRIS